MGRATTMKRDVARCWQGEVACTHIAPHTVWLAAGYAQPLYPHRRSLGTTTPVWAATAAVATVAVHLVVVTVTVATKVTKESP